MINHFLIFWHLTMWNVCNIKNKIFRTVSLLNMYEVIMHLPRQSSIGLNRISSCFWQDFIFMWQTDEYICRSEPQTGFSGSSEQSNMQAHRGKPSGPVSQVPSKSHKISWHTSLCTLDISATRSFDSRGSAVLTGLMERIKCSFFFQ